MKFLQHWKPKDAIAVLVIAGGMVLMALHIDTVVGGLVTLVAAFYFGRRKDDEVVKN